MLNVQRSRATAVMTLIISILAVYAATVGVLDKNIYNDLLQKGTISKTLLIGSVAQDIISIPLGLILAVLSIVFLKRRGYKSFIAILGLAWYFFYAYGLYVIQGGYTSIYLVYMVIFGLSIYSMIWGLLSFPHELVAKIRLSRALRLSVGVFIIIILFILVPGWLLRITPDIARHIPGETYGVFILDLCIVFPALGQITVMLFKNKPFGNILAGVALIKTLTLCLSWSFSEWFSPIYGGFDIHYDMAVISSALTVISFILLIPYMIKLKKD